MSSNRKQTAIIRVSIWCFVVIFSSCTFTGSVKVKSISLRCLVWDWSTKTGGVVFIRKWLQFLHSEFSSLVIVSSQILCVGVNTTKKCVSFHKALLSQLSNLIPTLSSSLLSSVFINVVLQGESLRQYTNAFKILYMVFFLFSAVIMGIWVSVFYL